MLGTVLLVLLILMLLCALPRWNHSRDWGYAPSGGLGLIVLILVVVLLMGYRFWSAHAEEATHNTAEVGGNLTLDRGYFVSNEEGPIMKTLLTAVVLLLVVVAVLGYFRGWYHVSTGNTDQNPSITVTGDPGRIKDDENRAKETVQGFGHKAKETARVPADKAE
jgi:hypothetical protein